MYIVSLYCSMSGMYVIGSIIFVAMGLYEPRDCPHLFGSSLQAYTVRKSWGYVLKIFSLTSSPQNRTVAFGIRCFARPSQAIRIFLQMFYVSQEAHLQPTSNFSRHFSSLDSSMQLEILFSTRISPEANPFNFSSSKRFASRSKTRLLPSPRVWDTRNPKHSS